MQRIFLAVITLVALSTVVVHGDDEDIPPKIAAAMAVLQKDPDNWKANRQVGETLLTGATPENAVPYLEKCGGQFQQLSFALAQRGSDIPNTIHQAVALLDAIAQCDAEYRPAVIALARKKLASIGKDASASQEQKAYAERLTAIAFRIDAKTGIIGVTDATTPPTTAVTTQRGENLRVVYVIDHSGSLLDDFTFVRLEVKASVGGLSPDQQVAVVAFSEDSEILAPPAIGLQKATAATKLDLTRRLDDVMAQGQNDDMLPPFQGAFEKAFALKPDVIYFFTDGHFDPRLLGVVKKLNADGKTKINTVEFGVPEKPHDQQLMDFAKQNGGVFSAVVGANLSSPPP